MHETKTIIIYTFTVQLYNVSTRSNTLKIVYTAGLASPRRTVFKSKVHDKIWFICTYTELRLKYKGFNSDCNRKTQFILQCTRQLCSVCQVCGVHKRAQTLVGWPLENLYIQSSPVNKMWLWAKTGNWRSGMIADVIYCKWWEVLPCRSDDRPTDIVPVTAVWLKTPNAVWWPFSCGANTGFNTLATSRSFCVERTAPQCEVYPAYVLLSTEYIHCMAPLRGGADAILFNTGSKRRQIDLFSK